MNNGFCSFQGVYDFPKLRQINLDWKADAPSALIYHLGLPDMGHRFSASFALIWTMQPQ